VNEEMTGKCLRQVEHMRGHLWHRYSKTTTPFILLPKRKQHSTTCYILHRNIINHVDSLKSAGVRLSLAP